MNSPVYTSTGMSCPLIVLQTASSPGSVAVKRCFIAPGQQPDQAYTYGSIHPYRVPRRGTLPS